jgi:hypothetical protein
MKITFSGAQEERESQNTKLLGTTSQSLPVVPGSVLRVDIY